MYPRLVINKEKLRYNIMYINKKCNDFNIKMTAVTKGFSSIPQIVDEILGAGINSLGDSRLDKIKELVESGVNAEFTLLRIPMMSELEDVIQYTSISLHSEQKILLKLNEMAKKFNKVHKVILMVDLGDLREGFWSYEELLETAKIILERLQYLELEGIGTNLGCYGSIKPTVQNLNLLLKMKTDLEKELDIHLNVVSGGGTSTMPLLFDGSIPKGINNLRCGEVISCGKSLHDNWKVDNAMLERDALYIEAEIVEIKEKPSYPVGVIAQDAFGNRPKYEDIGMRKRAIVGLGKKDIGEIVNIVPFDEKIVIVGGSSDHIILDITEVENSYDIGDIIPFHLKYPAMLYATTCDCVKKIII